MEAPGNGLLPIHLLYSPAISAGKARGRMFFETDAMRDSKLLIILSHYFLLTSLVHANLIKGLLKGYERN